MRGSLGAGFRLARVAIECQHCRKPTLCRGMARDVKRGKRCVWICDESLCAWAITGELNRRWPERTG